MNLIGLDIGTTTICGVLYSMKERKTLNVLVRNNVFINSSSGEYQQDPNGILQKIISILDLLIEASSDKIEGISLSSQMHGILYVDKDGQAVSPFFTWQNKRGLVKRGYKNLEESLSEMLGYTVYTGYGIVTHYSLFMERSIPASAQFFCNIGDYVCMNLVGDKVPYTDITLGNSMGLCDLRTKKEAESLSILGSECTSFIPEIVKTTKHLGEYKSIPVIQALGDNQASFLGSVKEKESSILLNYGTAGQISFYSNSYEQYPGFEIRPLGDEGYLHVAFSLCGGNSYKILARFFEDTVSTFTDVDTVNALKIMNEMVLDFTEENIDCMPLFMGKRDINGQSGYFKNLTESNFTVQNMIKALVQGMVNELYLYYMDLPEAVQKRLVNLIGAGNGIRKNRHLIQAAELKYGKTVTLYNFSEESCLGAVINAGKGLEIFSDYSEGADEIISYNIESS